MQKHCLLAILLFISQNCLAESIREIPDRSAPDWYLKATGETPAAKMPKNFAPRYRLFYFQRGEMPIVVTVGEAKLEHFIHIHKIIALPWNGPQIEKSSILTTDQWKKFVEFLKKIVFPNATEKEKNHSDQVAYVFESIEKTNQPYSIERSQPSADELALFKYLLSLDPFDRFGNDNSYTYADDVDFSFMKIISESASIKGELRKDQFFKVFEEKSNDLQYCYTRVFQSRPKAKKKMTINLTIDSTGKVSNAVVKRSDLGNDLNLCVVDILKGLKFENALNTSTSAKFELQYEDKLPKNQTAFPHRRTTIPE